MVNNLSNQVKHNYSLDVMTDLKLFGTKNHECLELRQLPNGILAPKTAALTSGLNSVLKNLSDFASLKKVSECTLKFFQDNKYSINLSEYESVLEYLAKYSTGDVKNEFRVLSTNSHELNLALQKAEEIKNSALKEADDLKNKVEKEARQILQQAITEAEAITSEASKKAETIKAQTDKELAEKIEINQSTINLKLQHLKNREEAIEKKLNKMAADLKMMQATSDSLLDTKVICAHGQKLITHSSNLVKTPFFEASISERWKNPKKIKFKNEQKIRKSTIKYKIDLSKYSLETIKVLMAYLENPANGKLFFDLADIAELYQVANFLNDKILMQECENYLTNLKTKVEEYPSILLSFISNEIDDLINRIVAAKIIENYCSYTSNENLDLIKPILIKYVRKSPTIGSTIVPALKKLTSEEVFKQTGFYPGDKCLIQVVPIDNEFHNVEVIFVGISEDNYIKLRRTSSFGVVHFKFDDTIKNRLALVDRYVE